MSLLLAAGGAAPVDDPSYRLNFEFDWWQTEDDFDEFVFNFLDTLVDDSETRIFQYEEGELEEFQEELIQQFIDEDAVLSFVYTDDELEEVFEEFYAQYLQDVAVDESEERFTLYDPEDIEEEFADYFADQSIDDAPVVIDDSETRIAFFEDPLYEDDIDIDLVDQIIDDAQQIIILPRGGDDVPRHLGWNKKRWLKEKHSEHVLMQAIQGLYAGIESPEIKEEAQQVLAQFVEVNKPYLPNESKELRFEWNLVARNMAVIEKLLDLRQQQDDEDIALLLLHL